MTAAPAHEWFQVKDLIAAKPTTHVRYRGHTGKHMLVLSFTGFDPTRTERVVFAAMHGRDLLYSAMLGSP